MSENNETTIGAAAEIEAADASVQEAKDIASYDGMDDMYLKFDLGEEVYSLMVRHVTTIIQMAKITKLPEMPPSMEGVINLRDSIIPVVSMRHRFGREAREFTDRTCIIVVTIGDKEIGLIVDTVQDVVTIDKERISPPPDTGEDSANKPYILGIGRLENATAILIDVQRLFSAELKQQLFESKAAQ